MLIKLHHDTDPRYLLMHGELPPRITIDDLANYTYGPLLIYPPFPVDIIYDQPGGPGTDWVKPKC